MIYKCNNCGCEYEHLPTANEYVPYGCQTVFVEMPCDVCECCGGDLLKYDEEEGEYVE